MSETRNISTAALVSLTTGTLLCEFGEMHRAGEFIAGHPIWTHHFADSDLMQIISGNILKAHPELPTKTEGVGRDNWREYRDAIEARFGKELPMPKGGGLSAMLPTDGIPDGVEIIEVKAP